MDIYHTDNIFYQKTETLTFLEFLKMPSKENYIFGSKTLDTALKLSWTTYGNREVTP